MQSDSACSALAGEASAQSLGFIDMGTMLCQGSADEPASCYSLTQLLVPGLEQRAWLFEPLIGVPVTPGKAFDGQLRLQSCQAIPHDRSIGRCTDIKGPHAAS